MTLSAEEALWFKYTKQMDGLENSSMNSLEGLHANEMITNDLYEISNPVGNLKQRRVENRWPTSNM